MLTAAWYLCLGTREAAIAIETIFVSCCNVMTTISPALYLFVRCWPIRSWYLILAESTKQNPVYGQPWTGLGWLALINYNFVSREQTNLLILKSSSLGWSFVWRAWRIGSLLTWFQEYKKVSTCVIIQIPRIKIWIITGQIWIVPALCSMASSCMTKILKSHSWNKLHSWDVNDQNLCF